MKRMILAAMLLAAPLVAQEKEERITRLVTLKYAEPHNIQGMVTMFGVQINSNDAMRVMALSGSPANVAAAEAAIKQLDVAPQNVELTVYFVVGGDDTIRPMAGTAVPPDVHDVIAQLKGAFAYKEYKMLDVLTLHTRTGSDAETSGLINAGSPPRMTQFSIRNARVGDDGTIRIDRMHAGLRIPFAKETGKNDYLNTGIDQSIDVKQGQKVVVGRSSLDGPERALFLILTARVIQ